MVTRVSVPDSRHAKSSPCSALGLVLSCSALHGLDLAPEREPLSPSLLYCQFIEFAVVYVGMFWPSYNLISKVILYFAAGLWYCIPIVLNFDCYYDPYDPYDY